MHHEVRMLPQRPIVNETILDALVLDAIWTSKVAHFHDMPVELVHLEGLSEFPHLVA